MAEQVPSTGLEILGSDTFALEGEVHRLVTFLNQCLKRHNLIFGLSKGPSGRLTLTIYAAHPEARGVKGSRPSNGRWQLDTEARVVIQPGPVFSAGQADKPE